LINTDRKQSELALEQPKEAVNQQTSELYIFEYGHEPSHPPSIQFCGFTQLMPANEDSLFSIFSRTATDRDA
jgi:hypothetical protein